MTARCQDTRHLNIVRALTKAGYRITRYTRVNDNRRLLVIEPYEFIDRRRIAVREQGR